MITSGLFWAILFGSALVHALLPRGRVLFLTTVSLAYVAYLDPISFGFVLGSALVWYGVGRAATPWRRRLQWSAIGAALLSLSYFKYLPALGAVVHGKSAPHVLVPLGMSYMTFKLVGFMLDATRGSETRPTLLQFLHYLSFFPVFTAGPIERVEPFLKNDPQGFDRVKAGKGLARIIYGLVKKLVIVDVLLAHPHQPTHAFYLWAPLSVDQVLAGLKTTTTLQMWQFAINRFVSSYLDFSAYSDIAIGGALLFGYEVSENFNYPVLATNISDFWKRWHMSLSAFCTRHVYMPTVGATRNPYLAMYATMLVMGVWHSGSLNLAAWGLYHATLLCGYQVWNRFKRRRGISLTHPAFKPLAWLITMATVIPATSFFSTDGHGIKAAAQIFLKLLGVTWA